MTDQSEKERQPIAEFFADGSYRLIDGYSLDDVLPVILELERKIKYFLDAIAKRDDPHVLSYIPASEILADMRTLQAILDKYDAAIYVPPAPAPKRGAKPDKFWEDMARREQQGNWNREHTLAEYRKRPEAQHESPEEQRTHATSMIHAARKRLKMPTKKYRKHRKL